MLFVFVFCIFILPGKFIDIFIFDHVNNPIFPPHMALATEYTLMTDEQDMQRVLNESKAGHVSVRKREAEEHILQKAYSHGIDEEMAYLRAEKRELYWKERELKALRDKERTDSRIARIRANKRQETMLRQAELAVARAKSAALHGEPGRATTLSSATKVSHLY